MPRAARAKGSVAVAVLALAVTAAGTTGAAPEADDFARVCKAPVTCQNEMPTSCCVDWVVDVLRDGQVWGALVDEAFDKLGDRIQKDVAVAAASCQLFGPADPSCKTTYGAPRCAGRGEGAPHAVLPPNDDRSVGAISAQQKESLAAAAATSPSLSAYEKLQRLVPFDGKPGDGDRLAGTVRDRFRKWNQVASNAFAAAAEQIRRANERSAQPDQCGRYFNPFLVPSPDARPDPWTVGLSFGGHVEARARARAAEEGRAALLSLVPRVPDGSNVAVLPANTDPGVVLTVTGSGSGRLLFGSLGNVMPKDTLPAGPLPVVFLALKGEQLTLGAVSLRKSLTPEGELVTVDGSSPAGHEVVELRRCTGGQTLLKNRCTCPGDRPVWNGTECAPKQP